MTPTRRHRPAETQRRNRTGGGIDISAATQVRSPGPTVEPVGDAGGAVADRVLAAVTRTRQVALPGQRSGDLTLRRGKKKKAADGSAVVPDKPTHSQEQIQAHIVEIWGASPRDEVDGLRATYMDTYSGGEGGWCDGWAYALAYGDGAALASLWQRIDEILDPDADAEALTVTEQFQAVELARAASSYHVTNNDRPTDEPQATDYDEAGYAPRGGAGEEWRGDYEETALSVADIIADVRRLTDGSTLRLTSATHDAAVKRLTKDDYVVSETEEFGVQRTESLEVVEAILTNWKEVVETGDGMFFSQKLVIAAR